MNHGPIFIGGLSFSGKTQLRLALNAHPHIVITRHTAMWERYDGRFGDLANDRNLERCLRAMVADPAIAALRPDVGRIYSVFRIGPATYAELFATFHAQHARRLGRTRWGDQMGLIERHADVLFEAYPDARMVHMIRDPRTRQVAALPQRRRLPGRTGWETARWMHSAELAERNRRRHPERYLVVAYEALVDYPEPVLREVIGFLGEAYDSAMLGALQQGTLDRRPVDAQLDAAARLTSCAFVERHAGRQLQLLGYPLAPTGPSRVNRRPPRTASPFDLAGLLAGRTAGAAALVSRGFRCDG